MLACWGIICVCTNLDSSCSGSPNDGHNDFHNHGHHDSHIPTHCEPYCCRPLVLVNHDVDDDNNDDDDDDDDDSSAARGWWHAPLWNRRQRRTAIRVQRRICARRIC